MINKLKTQLTSLYQGIVDRTKTTIDSVRNSQAAIKAQQIAYDHLTPHQLAQKGKAFINAKLRPWTPPPGWQKQMNKAVARVNRVKKLMADTQDKLSTVNEKINRIESQQKPSAKSTQTKTESVSYSILMRQLDQLNQNLKVQKKDRSQVQAHTKTSQQISALKAKIPSSILKSAALYKEQALLEERMNKLPESLKKAEQLVKHKENELKAIQASRFSWVAAIVGNLAVPGSGQAASIALTAVTTGAQIASAQQLVDSASITDQSKQAVTNRAACTVASTIASVAKDAAVNIIKESA